jgi:hypothetical protein
MKYFFDDIVGPLSANVGKYKILWKRKCCASRGEYFSSKNHG